uniref:Integrase n=1 Tax=Meloidogyne incognita TaxID=6306 RepID=A0A914NKG1_MELIC
MRTLAAGLHTEWQADLSIFDRLSSQNKGFKYLLVCIDTLSRMIFVEPVKSKHSDKMIEAFKRLFSRIKIVPWKLLTDQGLEFTAKEVKKYFKSIDMEHFSMFTSPQWHAGMAERANRSIKERLYRYFTEKRTLKWVDVIQDIVNAINNSFNSSIGMRPIDVTYKNAEGLRLKLKEQAREEVAPKRWKHTDFAVGDKVRLVPHQRPTYRLSDKEGELIRGWFYANDLCLVRERKKEDVLYDIEKVLKKKKFNGENQYFVKWKGYGSRFNSWIPASSVNWR